MNRDFLTEAVYFLLDNSSDYSKEIYETRPDHIELVVEELLYDILPKEIVDTLDMKLLISNLKRNLK